MNIQPKTQRKPTFCRAKTYTHMYISVLKNLFICTSCTCFACCRCRCPSPSSCCCSASTLWWHPSSRLEVPPLSILCCSWRPAASCSYPSSTTGRDSRTLVRELPLSLTVNTATCFACFFCVDVTSKYGLWWFPIITHHMLLLMPFYFQIN